MKTGIALENLTKEIKRQQAAKLDFIVPNNKVTFTNMGGRFEALIDMGDDTTHRFGLTAHAHNQLASYIGINKNYYQKMLQYESGLLAISLNQWFQRQSPENGEKIALPFGDSNRMVRTLDGNIRAFLSDSYLRIDNYDVMTALWPVFQEFPELQFESVNVTENNFYLKVVSPKKTFEVKEGDIVQAGVVITNSETGTGSFKIQPMTFRLWCLNGCTHAIMGDAIKRTHRGSIQLQGVQQFRAYGKDQYSLLETEMIENIRNSVRNVLSGMWMEHVAEKMQHATTVKIADPEKAVQILTNRKLVSEAEGELIMRNYLKHAYYNGETVYGLFNAVTRSSQDVDNYTRASELEALGDSVLDMYATFAKV